MIARAAMASDQLKSGKGHSFDPVFSGGVWPGAPGWAWRMLVVARVIRASVDFIGVF